MTMQPIDLLKAKHVGVRELKDHLSKFMNHKQPIVTTTHGEPKKVLVEYDDFVQLLAVVGDAAEPGFIERVGKARDAAKRGAEGLPFRVPAKR